MFPEDHTAFSRVHSVKVGKGPLEVQKADFNRDGFMDYVTADFDADTVTVLITRNGPLLFETITLYSGDGCMNTLIEDFNQDGQLDLVVIGAVESIMTIYTYTSAGTFEQKDQIHLPAFVLMEHQRNERARLRLMTAGRFLNTENRQLAVSVMYRLLLYEITPDLKFSLVKDFDLSPSVMQMLAVDFDANGLDELVLTHPRPSRVNIFKLSATEMVLQNSLLLDHDISGNVPEDIIAAPLYSSEATDLAMLTFGDDFYAFKGIASVPVEERISLPWTMKIDQLICDCFDHDQLLEVLGIGQDIKSNQGALFLVYGQKPFLYTNLKVLPLDIPYTLDQRLAFTATHIDEDALPDLAVCDYLKHELVFYRNITPPDE